MTMEGPRNGLAVAALAAREALGCTEIAVFADVFDRMSLPMVDIPPAQAASWAERLGADGLVLTGHSFADTPGRIAAARAIGVRRPILAGGSVTEDDVGDALAVADGAVVSTSLMVDDADPVALLRWDAGKVRRLMDRVRALPVDA